MQVALQKVSRVFVLIGEAKKCECGDDILKAQTGKRDMQAAPLQCVVLDSRYFAGAAADNVYSPLHVWSKPPAALPVSLPVPRPLMPQHSSYYTQSSSLFSDLSRAFPPKGEVCWF